MPPHRLPGPNLKRKLHRHLLLSFGSELSISIGHLLLSIPVLVLWQTAVPCMEELPDLRLVLSVLIPLMGCFFKDGFAFLHVACPLDMRVHIIVLQG